ncbi:patatin-like phospholipase family protein [Kineococcus rubinsiae]|uniref:patatin-like phospholipase family protein n=1 Tax=Kineococcus rubinsiae TaxID=2609562 RepID=UPI00142F64A9|nr:patatin-like phospholipase family protein [Kineococcus rubinsiae]
MTEPVDTTPYPADPVATCDLTMKGGVTSGVVYPAAVSRLARTYRIVNVGGASAGAIAAALTAAAEHARAGGDPTGYDRLEAVSAELAGAVPAGASAATAPATGLLALFQPEPRTRPLFGVLRAALDAAATGRWTRTLATALRQEVTSSSGWWRSVLPVVPGVLVTALAVHDLRAAAAPAALAVVVAVLGVALLVGGLAAGIGWALVHRLLREVPANGFGLVNGMGGTDPQPALTPWLTQRLDEIAGRRPDEGPLTFAHLWGARTPEEEQALLRDRRSRRVNLEVMTTDLVQGRPRRLPVLDVGTPAEEHLFFDVAEFRGLFPARVLEAVLSSPEAAPPTVVTGVHDVVAVLAARRGLHRLPRAGLPVVVATRMSLSFPGLVSAVPLHEFDAATPGNSTAVAAWARWLDDRRAAGLATSAADVLTGAPDVGVEPELLRTWISDGGITSNMPLHFFDAPLPTRPSFAINLQAQRPGEPRVSLPRGGDGGGSRLRNPFAQAAVPTLPPFVAAIARTMQNWVDNEQMRIPGYRERIVSVHLRPDEGGLNLAMPAPLIRTLSGLGRDAAGLLLRSYHDGTAEGWVDQRWIRYRSLMAMLERLFATVDRTDDRPDPATPVPTYEQMREGAFPPDVSPFTPEQQAWAEVRAAELVALARTWPAPVVTGDGVQQGSFTDGEPAPVPHWRAQPEL